MRISSAMLSPGSSCHRLIGPRVGPRHARTGPTQRASYAYGRGIALTSKGGLTVPLVLTKDLRKRVAVWRTCPLQRLRLLHGDLWPGVAPNIANERGDLRQRCQDAQNQRSKGETPGHLITSVGSAVRPCLGKTDTPVHSRLGCRRGDNCPTALAR